MEIKKQNAGRVLKVAVFLTIIFLLFLFFTYLFRNTDYNARQNVLDFYEEETELDEVFIGSSSIYRYWNPMEAWNAEGIATRNYSVSSMHLATYLPAIKDIFQTQNPDLIVVEARRFSRKSGENAGIQVGARNMLDSLDYNFSRLKSVHYYCEKMDIPWEDAVSLYIDLIQYHDNYDALATPLNWQLADNRIGNEYIEEKNFKGYALSSKSVVFEDPSENLVTETTTLNENSLMLYDELIRYCQENEIPLLILAMPMVITEEESIEMNSLKELTASYGVPFLDLNLHYEEIGLDFSTDFLDAHHVNVLGADKVTKYLASYLAEEYNLPDYRNDEAYASWHELYKGYSVSAEKARAEVKQKIEEE